MSSLDSVAMRLYRNGRWRSMFLEDVDYLADEETDEIGWLRPFLANDPRWRRVAGGWRK